MPKLSGLTSKATPTTADEVVITDKADSNKTKRANLNSLPISSAQASINSAKAPLASPTFTGTVTVPTLDVSAISGQAPFADGSAAAPSITNTGDTNTGFYFPSADSVGCTVAGSLAWTTDSSGNVLVGKSTTSGAVAGSALLATGRALHTVDGDYAGYFNRLTDNGDIVLFQQESVTVGRIKVASNSCILNAGNTLIFEAGGSEAARFDSGQRFLIGKTTSTSAATAGFEVQPNGFVGVARDGNLCGRFNRITDDGTIIEFRQDDVTEGSISVSGTTVSYNGGHLARWSRLLDGSKSESIKKGTVMTNLDEMIEWAYPEQPEVLWAAGDGLPEGVNVGDVKVEASEDEEGNVTPAVLWVETDGFPEGVSIGDVKTPYKAAGVEDNEQLNHTAVSSVEGDKNVAGVFVSWDEGDDCSDFNLAMTGDFIIRLAAGTVVERGDLLMSAGDGTAKPQADDLVRGSTIAKVTSTHVTCTYDDGSFCVPCVLMAC